MLLVPEHTDVSIDIEFNHIRHWAVLNKLILNLDKTKQMSSDVPESSIFTPLLVSRTLNSWIVISFWESFFSLT